MPLKADAPLVVRSEADAWNYLRSALQNELPESSAIRFEGWPHLHIYLDVGDASMRPTMMRAFVEFQEAIWRAHARVVHGEANISLLSDEEKSALELDVLVRGGSSDFDAKLAGILDAMAQGIKGKMTGNHWTIAIISVATIYFGSTVWKADIDSRVEERKALYAQEEHFKKLEAQVQLSKEETERMRMLDAAYKKVAALQDIAREAEQARTSFLKSVPPEASAELQGMIITGSVANDLAKKPRETLSGNQEEATFIVQRVDARKVNGFGVRILNVSTGQAFTADLSDEAPSDTKRVIERATFDKKPIIAVVDVFRKKGKVKRAVILKALAAPADIKVELITPKTRKAAKKKTS